MLYILSMNYIEHSFKDMPNMNLKKGSVLSSKLGMYFEMSRSSTQEHKVDNYCCCWLDKGKVELEKR